ncbi:MAG: hypothetical protein U0937_01370, partial [Thermodesulfovibrionia bacterium]|nr:hypothetical protein [Thermodesulfovibrionia bacterium]
GGWGGVQFLKLLIMGIDMYTLATEFPDMVIQVKVGDLIEAAHVFAKDLAASREIKTKELMLPDTLLTKKEVMELLGIGETTLWRWATKYNYLQPVMIGAERRWRWKDITAIIDGKITDSYNNPVWTNKSNRNPR